MRLFELTPNRVILPAGIRAQHRVDDTRQLARRGDARRGPAEARLLRDVVPRQPAVRGMLHVRDDGPHERPAQIKKSCAPLVHAASQRVRKELRAAYHAFVAAFREAAECLPARAGELTKTFPIGSFPPALPFVGG